MKLKIFIDGAARGNPGDAGIGVIIRDDKKVISRISAYLGKTTNNIAEYMALIRALEEALLLGSEHVNITSDSELLVKQVQGEYKVKNEGLQPLYHHLKSLIKKFKHFGIQHTYRESNKEADQLANKGIDDHFMDASPLFGR